MLKIFLLVINLCFGNVCARVESDIIEYPMTQQECNKLLEYEKSKVEYYTQGEVKYGYCQEAVSGKKI